MSIDLNFSIDPLKILIADLLSGATSVGYCRWPISDRDVLIDVAFRQFSKNSPNSSYVSDAMTCIIMLHYIGTGPFYRDIDCIGVLDFSIKLSTCSALCFWFEYGGCIRMYVEIHSDSSVF